MPPCTLGELTPVSGPRAEVCVRALKTRWYEVSGKRQVFTVFAIMLVDKANNMMWITENLFGDAKKRAEIVKQREAFWLPRTVWLLQQITKVQRQNFGYLSGSVPNTIIVENFQALKATVKILAGLPGMQGQDIPMYYLPRQSLASLERLPQGMFVTVTGTVLELSDLHSTTEGDLIVVSISDGTTRVDGVKCWKEMASSIGAVPEGSTVVLENFWCGLDEAGVLSKLVSTAKSTFTVLEHAKLSPADLKYVDSFTQEAKHVLYLDDKGNGGVRRTMAEWGQQPAMEASALVLSALSVAETTQSELYRLDGVHCQVDFAADTLSSKGDVWARLEVTDLTGSVTCRTGEAVLLALMGLPESEGKVLQEHLALRFVLLQRASIYVERKVLPRKDDATSLMVSLTVRAAKVNYFPRLRSDGLLCLSAGLMPARASDLKVVFGRMVCGTVPARLPMVLLRGGHKPPKTDLDKDGNCAIINHGATDGECSVDVTATVPLQVQTAFALEPKKYALVVVSGPKESHHFSTSCLRVKVVSSRIHAFKPAFF